MRIPIPAELGYGVRGELNKMYERLMGSFLRQLDCHRDYVAADFKLFDARDHSRHKAFVDFESR